MARRARTHGDTNAREPAGVTSGATGKRPHVVAAFRQRHWDNAQGDPRLSKSLMRSLLMFGYTRVRLMDSEGAVEEFHIKELL